MKITKKEWNKYIQLLSGANKTAAKKMQAWINAHGYDDVEAMIEYAYSLTTAYGEAAASISCEMFEAIANAEKKTIKAAEPATTFPVKYVEKAIKGKLNSNPGAIPGTVGEIVKRTGAETTLKNALREGAYFAWVPNGDTCAFCIMLASNGWQKASRRAIKGGHAEHIHKNCDCEYAISFNGPGDVEGYNQSYYKNIYKNAEGNNAQEKTNYIRRIQDLEKRFNYTDVTKEYFDKAKPNTGRIVVEDKVSESDKKTAEWLKSKFGGNIVCLADNPLIGKMPDAIWEGMFWEFKAPTTKNAIDSRMRQGHKQLLEALNRQGTPDNRCGLVFDISGIDINREQAIAEIANRSKQRIKKATDIIIKDHDEVLIIMRIK